jgi:hypothetical protein
MISRSDNDDVIFIAFITSLVSNEGLPTLVSQWGIFPHMLSHNLLWPESQPYDDLKNSIVSKTMLEGLLLR